MQSHFVRIATRLILMTAADSIGLALKNNPPASVQLARRCPESFGNADSGRLVAGPRHRPGRVMAKKATKEHRGSSGIGVSGAGRHADGGFDFVCPASGQTDRPDDGLAQRRSTLRGRAKGAFGTWLREVEDRCSELADPCEGTAVEHSYSAWPPEVRQSFYFAQIWLIIEIHSVPPVLPARPQRGYTACLIAGVALHRNVCRTSAAQRCARPPLLGRLHRWRQYCG